MTLKKRIERVEQICPANNFDHLSDEELDTEIERRTVGWTDADWVQCWEIAREMGWSEAKIANAKALEHGP